MTDTARPHRCAICEVAVEDPSVPFLDLPFAAQQVHLCPTHFAMVAQAGVNVAKALDSVGVKPELLKAALRTARGVAAAVRAVRRG